MFLIVCPASCMRQQCPSGNRLFHPMKQIRRFLRDKLKGIRKLENNSKEKEHET